MKQISIFFLIVALAFSQVTIEPVNEDSEKVQIKIYTESLCPFSINFYVNSFKKAIETPGFNKIAEYKFYPFGNALMSEMGGTWYFQCQHGPMECYGNTFQSCANHYLDSISMGKFMVCISEKSLSKIVFDKNGEECLKELGLQDKFKEIQKCASNKQGNQLLHDIGMQSNELIPQKTYVPWLVADNQHDDVIQQQMEVDLVKFVCQHYVGDEVIQACQEHVNQVEFQKFKAARSYPTQFAQKKFLGKTKNNFRTKKVKNAKKGKKFL